MILEINKNVERYDDGTLMYIETIATINPNYAHKYPNRRTSDDGETIWIRIGENKKFNPDGTMQWELLYDDYGNVIK